MSEAEAASFLEQERTVTCATIGPRGWPHLMPLWYVLREAPAEDVAPTESIAPSGLRVWAWTYAASQKARNLERDPRATLQIEAGELYQELRGVMIECDVILHCDVETVVADHPAVGACAAVAVRAESAGGEDEIKLCVTLHDGAHLVPEEFLAWCEDRLPHFAVPRYLEIVPELPRTATNKVQKHLLRERRVTGTTWDRVAAGYRLQEEIRRAARKRAPSQGALGPPSE